MKNHLSRGSILIALIALMFHSCTETEPEIPVYSELLAEVNNLSLNEIIVGESVVRSYRIAGIKLESSVNVSVEEGDFLISKEANSGFGTNLEISPAEFSNNLFSVFVRFSAEQPGTFSGKIIHRASGVVLEPVVNLSVRIINDPSDVANLLASDLFEYSGSELPSTNRTENGVSNAEIEGWVKVRNANSPISLNSSPLTFPGYSGENRGRSVNIKFTAPASNSNLYALNLSEQQTSDFVGDYYASFLIKVNGFPAAGQFNRPVMFIDWLPNGTADFNTAIQVRNENGESFFGLQIGGQSFLSDLKPETGKTYLAVLKHSITDSDPSNANNESSLYIFDGNVPNTEPEEPLLLVPNTIGDNRLIKAISLLNDNSAAGEYLIDGMKVSLTWEDLFK